jgi:molybdenum cofactor cytidylyltransferase
MNGIIILAAGNSSRLGQPKQLLKYRNKSLIRHVTQEALASGAGPVIVVTGADQTAVAAEIGDLAVAGSGDAVLSERQDEFLPDLEETSSSNREDASLRIIVNEIWQEGMASSIRKGLSEMLDHHSFISGVILTVCDQPFVSAPLFRELVKRQEEGDKRIIACSYAGILGTPVLFGRKYFPSLFRLDGQEGAKKLLRQYPQDLDSVLFDLGEIDIDTYADYEQILRR